MAGIVSGGKGGKPLTGLLLSLGDRNISLSLSLTLHRGRRISTCDYDQQCEWKNGQQTTDSIGGVDIKLLLAGLFEPPTSAINTWSIEKWKSLRRCEFRGGVNILGLRCGWTIDKGRICEENDREPPLLSLVVQWNCTRSRELEPYWRENKDKFGHGMQSGRFRGRKTRMEKETCNAYGKSTLGGSLR